MNNRTLGETRVYLVAAVLSAIVVLGLLFLYAAPRLSLEGGIPPMRRPKRRQVAALCILVGLVGLLAAPSATAQQALGISVDLAYTTVNAGDEVEFSSVVTNNGPEESPHLNVAMNIVKTGQGDPVDPEDWSPERTQEIESLAPGDSEEQSWTVEAILEGDYMVYLTVIPTPDGPEATSQPVSSSGIHLTVEPFANSNPGGVLPVVIGVPVVLALVSVIPRRSKRWRPVSSGGNA